MKNLIKSTLLIAVTLSFSSCEKTFQDYNVADIPKDFVALAKPEVGSGYQIRIEPFPVQSNFEREFYIRKSLGNANEEYLTGFEMKARPGTHHLIAYSTNDDGPMPPENVMVDQNQPNNTLSFRSGIGAKGPLFQSPQANYKFNLPAGYGLVIPKNTSFIMNSHYFNKTAATRFGEIYMNFYTKPKEQIKQLLEVDYLSPENITLPANKKTTMTTDFIMEKETYIPMMLSHYHKRGELFEVRIKGGPRNGELIYTSTFYEDPLVKTFSPALVLQKGEGLTTVVTYNNNTNRTINYGVSSEDEMNIVIIFKHNK